MTPRPPIVALLCSLVCLLLVPAAADAGSYQVRTCHADGINAVFFPNGASGGAAYAECPGGVNGSDGLIVRNTNSSTPAPSFSYARLSATAPAGTYFQAINFVGQVYNNSRWQSGLYDGQNQRWIWCGFCGTLPFWTQFNVGGFATTRLDILTICGAELCNRSGLQGAMMLTNVTLRLQDLRNPSVAIVGGSLASGGWKRGIQTLDVAGSDNTGVRSLRVLIDGIPANEQHPPCDDHRLVPCPSSATRPIPIETQRFPDGRHSMTAQAFDSGGNISAVSRWVFVDNTPPDAPQLDLPASDGWHPANSFEVNWANPSAGAGAPIAGAAYQVCADADSALECRPTQRQYQTGITALKAIKLPAPGSWRLRVWLIDAARNENPQTFRDVTLRWDPDPPAIGLLPPLDEDPARVSVRAADPVSGIAAAEIELRRESESTWHSLPIERSASGFSAVIDDEVLPPGTYALRARARDHAGNERSVEGSPVRLPIRLGTALAVGKSKRVEANRAGSRRGRQRLIRRPRIGFGRSMKLTGRLTSPGGNPLADRDIDVAQRLELPNEEWQPVATVRTRSSGRFAFKAPAGPSRLLRFRFPGSSTIRGTTGLVELRVRAASSMRVSKGHVVNGEAVRFSGTVWGDPLPAAGKLLQLQVYSRGRWLTFATPRANARGRWRHRYRFTATRGVTRYRFRVRIPPEAGYPYEAGVSHAVKVAVTGL